MVVNKLPKRPPQHKNQFLANKNAEIEASKVLGIIYNDKK